jgi:hypothetical protein
MTLSKLQRETLKAWMQSHDEGFPAGPFRTSALLRQYTWPTIGLLALAIFLPITLWVATALIGIFVGYFLRDLQLLKTSAALWPAVDRVVDWDRVAELLQAETDHEGQAALDPALR